MVRCVLRSMRPIVPTASFWVTSLTPGGSFHVRFSTYLLRVVWLHPSSINRSIDQSRLIISIEVQGLRTSVSRRTRLSFLTPPKQHHMTMNWLRLLQQDQQDDGGGGDDRAQSSGFSWNSNDAASSSFRHSTSAVDNDDSNAHLLFARDLVLVFVGLSIVAICIMIVRLYLPMWLDKHCFRLEDEEEEEAAEAARRRQQQQQSWSHVVDKAGLCALEPKERQLILQYIFVPRSKVFADKMTRPSKRTRSDTAAACLDSVTDLEAGLTTTAYTASSSTAASTAPPTTEATETLSTLADHERICCICLAEYEPPCRVLSGMTCQHTMHTSCALQWMEKHDHCPYCRQEMMTPEAVRLAAYAVLGPQRVDAMEVEETGSSLMTTFPSATNQERDVEHHDNADDDDGGTTEDDEAEDQSNHDI